MTRRPRSRRVAATLLAAVVAATAAWIAWFETDRHVDPLPPITAAEAATLSDAETIARGEYLARAGNCIGCHTARGGADYAGGRGIETPFGTVFASNLTPDDETGIGRWSPAAFRRAMHEGRSHDGRLLYPAFPYPSYSHVRDGDVAAIHAFLRSLQPVRQPRQPHALRFPYGTRSALAAWRALYFRPADDRDTPDATTPADGRTAALQRGSYLVRGLGHCAACHAGRNALGATDDPVALGGGQLPMQHWRAPSLSPGGDAGVADWPTDEVVQLLKTGISPRGAAMGPMAEVVYSSTQHLDVADLRSIAVYLQSLPPGGDPAIDVAAADPAVMARGERIYGDHCADCHRDDGSGVDAIYPALRGNGAVTGRSPNNLIIAILHGGFPPTTAGNPRPYGMPPYGPTLDDRTIADVATYVRQSWGHAAPPVSALDVARRR